MTPIGLNPHPADNVWLSRRVKVRKYREMEATEDQKAIAKFIYERFMERYILPLRAVTRGEENGFLMMAACCLLIEGLTAFREGWCSTEGLSERAFQLFFKDEPGFIDFREHERSFWKGVRCGILHQGETSLGWKLNFSRPQEALLVEDDLMVNCLKFMDEMDGALLRYQDELINSPWKYEIWRNLRKKMAATIQDCEA